MKLTILTATALAAVACFRAPVSTVPGEEAARLRAIAQALDVRASEPDRAAALLASAGPGAALESLRLELWVDSLERSDPGPEEWQALTLAPSTPSIARRVRLGLAASLATAGRHAEAVSVLESAPPADRTVADRLLLTLGAEPADRAARRLVIADPAFLEREDPRLAHEAASALGPEERLERARRWRDLGSPSRAVAELRRGRWPEAVEGERRLELARSELERGSPSRALAELPTAPEVAAEALVIRGAALRARSWGRFPDDSARRDFRECVEAVRPFLGTPPATTESWLEAQRLLLECGTESGQLDDALAAWRALEAAGWSHERRGWLGRRLGVGLAVAGRPEAETLAAALPEHARCLDHWIARFDPDRSSRTRRWKELVETPVSDLYGSWARQRLGLPAGPPPPFAPEVVPAPSSSTAAWLLDRGEPGLALDEWRRIRDQRGVEPAEAFAAAMLAARLGRRNEVISWIRIGFPEVAGPEVGSVPVNVARAYLPLEWEAELVAAARSHGLSPWLVAAVARQESTFNPRARSPAGAVGLLQLMRGTARGHARALGLGLRPDLTDPAVNLALGSRELAALITRFGALEPALAAYNAGESRVRRWWRQWPDRETFVEAIPIPETYTYVRRVVFLAEAYRVTYPEVLGEGR